MWFTGGEGGESAGCLFESSCKTDEEEVAMPKDVSVDTARERSPSAASVDARRAFTSICSDEDRFGSVSEKGCPQGINVVQ